MGGVLGKQQECRMSTKHRYMIFGLVLVYLELMKGDLIVTTATEAVFHERSFRLRNPDFNGEGTASPLKFHFGHVHPFL